MCHWKQGLEKNHKLIENWPWFQEKPLRGVSQSNHLVAYFIYQPCDIKSANDEMANLEKLSSDQLDIPPLTPFSRCIWEYTDTFKLALAYGSIRTLSMCWRTYFDPRKNIWPNTFKDMKRTEIWDKKGHGEFHRTVRIGKQIVPISDLPQRSSLWNKSKQYGGQTWHNPNDFLQKYLTLFAMDVAETLILV